MSDLISQSSIIFPLSEMDISRCPKCVNIPQIELIRKKDKDYIKYECINGHKEEINLEDYFIKSKMFSIDNSKCKYCEKNKQLLYCNECNCFICLNCKMKHDMENKDHILISINKIDIKCLKHNREINYCKDCDKSCCILCKEPKSHNVIPINHMLLEEEEIKKYEKIIKNMEEMIKMIENKCNKIIEKVKNMINKQLNEFKEKHLLEIKLANEILETYKMKDKIEQLNPNIIKNTKNILQFNNIKFNPKGGNIFEELKYMNNFFNDYNMFLKGTIIDIELYDIKIKIK